MYPSLIRRLARWPSWRSRPTALSPAPAWTRDHILQGFVAGWEGDELDGLAINSCAEAAQEGLCEDPIFRQNVWPGKRGGLRLT